MLPPLWCILTILYFLIFRIASAQPSTTAECGSSFHWMNNVNDQSPCLMAAYAFSACTSTVFAIPPMDDPAATYGAPGGGSVTECGCNSVTYSLITACSLCQGAAELDWSAWTENCPKDFILDGTWPSNHRIGTDFPSWALQTISGSFNVTLAREVATGIGSVSPASGTSSSPSITPSSSSVVPTSTSTSSSFSSSMSATSSDTPSPSPSTTFSQSSFSASVMPLLLSSTSLASLVTIESTDSAPPSTQAAVTITVFPTVLPPSNSSTAQPSVSVAADSSQNTDKHSKNLGAIIGGSVGGGVGLLLLIGFIGFPLYIRQRQKKEDRINAPYNVDGLRLYEPEDETTWPKPEWSHVPSYTERQSVIQFHSNAPPLVPNRAFSS